MLWYPIEKYHAPVHKAVQSVCEVGRSGRARLPRAPTGRGASGPRKSGRMKMDTGNRTKRGGRTERLLAERHLHERCYATIWVFQYRSRKVSDLFDIEGTNATCNAAYGRSITFTAVSQSMARGPKDNASAPELAPMLIAHTNRSKFGGSPRDGRSPAVC